MVGRAGGMAEGEHRVGEVDQRGTQVWVGFVGGVLAGLDGSAEVGEGLREGGEEAEVKGAFCWESGGEVFDLGWAGAGCRHGG